MSSPLAAAALDDLRSFLELGLSVMAVTRDEKMFPAIARCGGARLGPDGIVRALVAMPEGKQVLANLEATGAIALSCVRPSTYRTLQVKGADARRIEWRDGDEVALAHRRALRPEIEQVGLPSSICDLLYSNTFVAIGFTPVEIFDQTPGPTAGLALIA